jgi:hypothetical protein
MEPKYRAISKGQFLENIHWMQLHKAGKPKRSKKGGDFVF